MSHPFMDKETKAEVEQVTELVRKKKFKNYFLIAVRALNMKSILLINF